MTGPVSDHYNRADLLSRIERAIGTLDRTPDTVSIDELAPLEEFHVGGRAATVALLPDLKLTEETHALDVGCGTGGVSRFAAHRYGCEVDGIDLTPGFISAGKAISSWLKLSSKVHLHCASALHMPFEDETFDAAWMFHVGMNIREKRELFAQVFRTLKPDASFLVYDIMRGEDDASDLVYPLPWASDSAISHVRTPDEYEAALEAAGFAIDKVRPRHDLADPFFDRVKANAGKPPPPVSTGALMGDDAAAKIANLHACYRAKKVVPVQILARKPA